MLMLEYNGCVYSMAELSRISGLPRNTIESRLHRGWPVDRAVETPTNTSFHRIVHCAPKPKADDVLYNAALNICKTISGDPEGHHFRCIAPGVFAFEGDILCWRIRFFGREARLTAFYRSSGMASTLLRTYKINGECAKEVNVL